MKILCQRFNAKIMNFSGHEHSTPNFRVKKLSCWIVDDRHPLGAKVNTRGGSEPRTFVGDIDKYMGLDKQQILLMTLTCTKANTKKNKDENIN